MTVLETKRLRLRWLTMGDLDRLRPILQDAEVMYAWEHAFSDEEIQAWLLENLRRYETDGYSYLAVLDRGSGELLGVAGLLTEHIEGTARLGIGWIFGKQFWGQGFAREAAKALLCCAFEELGAGCVVATIRPENRPSRRLAERLGMRDRGSFLKLYQGRELRHLVYEIDCENWKECRNLRRKDRERDRAFALRVIDSCEYAVLAMVTPEHKPYAVPLTIVREGDTVYFHSSQEGRKAEVLRRSPEVCLTCVGKTHIVESKFTTEYESAIARGTAEEITDDAQKIHALRLLCERHTPGNMDAFDAAIERSLHRTAVFAVRLSEIQGKGKGEL